MNIDLLNIVKQIVVNEGDAVLSDHKRVSAFLEDMAQDVPKPQKNVLVKCLEYNFYLQLKDSDVSARQYCKNQLSQRLHSNEGFDLTLCKDSIAILSAVLFNDVVAVPEKEVSTGNGCKKCGESLQERWNACPFCGTLVVLPTVVSSQSRNDDDGNDNKNAISMDTESSSGQQPVIPKNDDLNTKIKKNRPSESKNVTINITGGTNNLFIASDGIKQINKVSGNSPQIDRLLKILKENITNAELVVKLEKSIPKKLDQNEFEEINNYVGKINDEIEKPTPRKNIINRALNSMKTINGALEFVINLTIVMQHLIP